jgi:PAS domain S-box-containing protein
MESQDQVARSANLIESIKLLSFDGVLAFDRKCQYTLWNPAMESISGFQAADVVGRNAFEAFPFLKSIGEDRNFLESLQGGSPLVRNRPYNVVETGKRGFFDGAYGPLLSADGEVLGGICVIRNVTDRVIREEFFERSRDVQLENYAPNDNDIVSQGLLKALGAAIQQRRRIMAISQEELAFRAGLHRTYISDIERGTRNIAVFNIVRLAQALELHPWVLIAQAEKPLQPECPHETPDHSPTSP